MTWVVGCPAGFGYAFGIADIQVTFPNLGRSHDCLRKVYHIGRDLVVGFSGSVKIGFALIEDLTLFLSPPLQQGECWIPNWVAWKWWRRARRIFRLFDENERRLGASIILLGVSVGGGKTLYGAEPDVIRFQSHNEFEPGYTQFDQFVSIGSGNNVSLYVNELRAQQDDMTAFMQAEVGSPSGMAKIWAGQWQEYYSRILRPGLVHTSIR